MAEKSREELVGEIMESITNLRASAYEAYEATNRCAKQQYDLYERLTQYMEFLVTGKQPEDNVEGD